MVFVFIILLYVLLLGCKSILIGELLLIDCNVCLYFKWIDIGECVKICFEGFREKDVICVLSKFNI